MTAAGRIGHHAPMRRVAVTTSLLVLVACTAPAAEGGMGLPTQVDGEDYPGARREIRGTVAVSETGCIELETDDGRWFVIWPSGSRLDALVRLPNGTVLDEGDRIVAAGALTPVRPLVADAGGYWANTIGFCAPDATDVLVLDEARAGP
jgi:hypothetical protein